MIFVNMKQVYDISKGQASCIQKKISDWTINGGGLVLNIEQGTIARLNHSAEIIFLSNLIPISKHPEQLPNLSKQLTERRGSAANLD